MGPATEVEVGKEEATVAAEVTGVVVKVAAATAEARTAVKMEAVMEEEETAEEACKSSTSICGCCRTRNCCCSTMPPHQHCTDAGPAHGTRETPRSKTQRPKTTQQQAT